MGLAPYGEPTYLDLMRELVRPTPGGGFELNLDYHRALAGLERNLGEIEFVAGGDLSQQDPEEK